MQVFDGLRKEITIQNIVCTADLKQPVNLNCFNEYKHLWSKLELYQCGYVKDNTMKGCVMVFASGKITSVGTKQIETANIELQKAGNILKKYKIISTFEIVPTIQNIVGKFDLGKKVHLEKLARLMPKSMYEPEQFAGLKFSIQNSQIAWIFASGKGVLVGAKSVNEMNQGLFEIEKWINI